jgi:hypothetical protein
MSASWRMPFTWRSCSRAKELMPDDSRCSPTCVQCHSRHRSGAPGVRDIFIRCCHKFSKKPQAVPGGLR